MKKFVMVDEDGDLVTMRNNPVHVGGGSGPQIIHVTTGASPVNITLSDYTNWTSLAVLVTSGGTAGTEALNFIGPDDGEQTYSTVGKTINVVFVHQTDPSDEIHITQNTTGTFTCLDNLGNSIGGFSEGIFNQEGNNIVFTFTGDVIQQYRWNCLYGAFDSATIIGQKRGPVPSGGTYGQLLFSSGEDNTSWGTSFPLPVPLYNAGTVNSLNTYYPAGSYNRGMATVYDADTPVVGSVVTGGGSSGCVVISNGSNYVVMFIF